MSMTIATRRNVRGTDDALFSRFTFSVLCNDERRSHERELFLLNHRGISNFRSAIRTISVSYLYEEIQRKEF